MRKGDVFDINGGLYVVAQDNWMLDLNTVILLPILPADATPELSRITVEIEIDGVPHRVLAHMPLTVEARRVRRRAPVTRLTPNEMNAAMDGLNAMLWGV